MPLTSACKRQSRPATSKAISYGNAVVLDSPDLLEYLLEDDETTVIGMYIEGPRDGRRLFEVIKRTLPRKPLLIWRGGQTPAGSRATASPCTLLSCQSRDISGGPVFGKPGRSVLTVWKKWSILIKALQNGSKPSTGQRFGLVTMTGGPSVVITDTFARVGLDIPTLTEASYEMFQGLFNIIGEL